jgi:hypothetical protein
MWQKNNTSPGRGTGVADLGAGAHWMGCRGQRTTDGGCGPIVVIDRCEAAQSYLARCLEEATGGANVVAFANAAQWLQVAHGYLRPKVILICNSGHEDFEGQIARDLSLLASLTDVPVIAVPNADARIAAFRGTASGQVLNRAEGGKQDEAFLRAPTELG